MRKFLRSFVALLFAAILGVVGVSCQSFGFKNLSTIRQIELTPQREVIAILPGIVNLQGSAQPIKNQTIASPKTLTECLYYRYKVEEERGSGDDRRWHVVSDTSKHVPFYLTDETSSVEVDLNGFSPEVSKSFTVTVGNWRYTEYRIDKGEPLFIFGYAEKNPDPNISSYVIKFPKSKGFKPIVSDEGEQSSRRGIAGLSISQILFGSLLIILACCFFCIAIHILHSLLVLWLAAIVLSCSLALIALDVAKKDVERAQKELHATTFYGKEHIAQILERSNISWDKRWWTLNEESYQKSLSQERLRQISAIKVLIAKMELRFKNGLTRWPESMFSDQFVASEITLTKEQELRLRIAERNYQPTAFTPLGSGILIALGSIFLGLFGVFGFKKIHLKRLIENITTATPSGAVYGLNELSGRAALVSGEEKLPGPISGKACVAYRYLTQELRRSGKNSHWHTISDTLHYRRFVLNNFTQDGSLEVDPEGCELITSEKLKKREGSMRYFEYPLFDNDKIYALGPVGISEDSSHLILRADAQNSPFILSNLSEEEVLIRKASSAFFQLALSLVGGIAISLGFAGQVGSFGALPWILCSLTPIGFLSIATLVLMYNDLIFLRNRVWATLSNIEVSLKKRSSLIPQLETIAKAYFEHEKGLQENISTLRNLSSQSRWSSSEGDKYISSEAAVASRMIALVEQYPNLKGDEAIGKLMTALRQIEDELGFMREGHNNAVERYNTRREHFPEVLLSKLFHFEELALLHPSAT